MDVSISLVNRLIKEGKYKEAEYESQMLSPVMALIYQSRIAELTGYFDQALKLGTKAFGLAKSSEERLAAAICQAYAYWRLFDFSSGHIILDEVRPELEETTLELNPWRGTYYNIRGLLYWKEDALEEALKNFETALVIREDIGDNSPIAYTLNNLGNTYLKFKDFEKAESYYSQSRDRRELLQHKPAMAASANSFGRLYDAQGNYLAARKQHELCLSLWKEVGNTQFIAKAYRFLAINAANQGLMDDFSEYIHRSTTLFQEIGNSTDVQTNGSLSQKYMT